MVFVIKVRLHEGRRSSAIIWLCLWFSSICSSEISQNFHNLWKLSCVHLKAEKNRGYEGSFHAIWNFVFSSSISNLVMIFFIKGTRKGTNMFNGTVNLRKFHRMKPDKSYSKDLYFLCCKTLLSGYRTSSRSCLSMRWISNLSPFGNLSHDVFFSLDLFFRGWRPVNITGAVTGNPRFHQIQTVLCLTVFKTPFQMTIAPP